jgi:hypothetical protein
MRILRPGRVLLNSLVLGALLIPARSLGQLSTDQIPRKRTVPAREQVRGELEKRRFRLGPLRLIPELNVSNAGYDSNVFGASAGHEITDWTATISAGFRWLVPVGSKLYVIGDVLPQYTWYKTLEERRFFGGTVRAALLGFFNRASLEVGGFESRDLRYATSETETQLIETALDGSLKMEVDVASNFSVFGGAEVTRIRYRTLGGQPSGVVFVDPNQFNRTEEGARGGIRYRISSSLDISAAYEKTRTEFSQVPEQNDNQSDAYLLGIHYDRPRFFVNLSGGYRRGKPFNGSSFAEYSEPTGSYFISYFLTRTVELGAYGGARVTYGLTSSQFLEVRNGGNITVRVHPRVTLSAFGSYGTNRFPATSGGGVVTAGHTDKAIYYGGSLSAVVFRKISLTAQATESRYRSNQPDLNRNVVRYTTSLSLAEVFSR